MCRRLPCQEPFHPVAFSRSSADLSIDPATGIIDPSHSIPGSHAINYYNPALYCVLPFTTTAVVTINQSPTISVSPDVKITPGASTTLLASGSAANYEWYP